MINMSTMHFTLGVSSETSRNIIIDFLFTISPLSNIKKAIVFFDLLSL